MVGNHPQHFNRAGVPLRFWFSFQIGEELAEYLAGQLREKIGHLPNLTACEMEVSEVEGQSAFYREEWR